jgi:citrate lyase subunit beta/citryl-CoA lyase
MQFAAVNGWREGCHMDGNLRRSLLAVPASSAKMVEKSKGLVCDQILFDLEDAVSPAEKAGARANLIALFASQPTFQARYISIRINAANTPYFKDDLAALKHFSSGALFSLVMPKVESASDVDLIEAPFLIDAQIESAAGLSNVESIAAHPRVLSLSYGPLDFAADLGANLGSLTESDLKEFTLYPLMRILVAARANGKLAFDGPEVDIRNSTKFTAGAERVRALGFDGKWVLHPDQVAAANEVFSPNQGDYDHAELILDAYDYYTSAAGGARGAATPREGEACSRRGTWDPTWKHFREKSEAQSKQVNYVNTSDENALRRR